MVTGVTAATALVAIAKLTVVALAGTVTVAGTVAALRLLLARFTTAPPAGADAPSVTLPVLPTPPFTVAGVTVTPTSRIRVAPYAVNSQITGAATETDWTYWDTGGTA